MAFAKYALMCSALFLQACSATPETEKLQAEGQGGVENIQQISDRLLCTRENITNCDMPKEVKLVQCAQSDGSSPVALLQFSQETADEACGLANLIPAQK